MVIRYRLVLEYDGRPFVGWQRQINGPSVQQAVEEAAFALCGVPVTANAAGRTDAGVHALAMGAHIDLPRAYRDAVVRDALNQHLKPRPVAVLHAAEVSDNFHARFSCTGRHYEYRILNRRPPPVLQRGQVWHVSAPLDAMAMHAAASALVGRHDFTTFRAAQCQAHSPIKTLKTITVTRAGDEVILRCSAPSFLHHQIRSITGSLVEVGRGKWRPQDLRAALEARNRTACGPVAPPDGLYFVRADYDTEQS